MDADYYAEEKRLLHEEYNKQLVHGTPSAPVSAQPPRDVSELYHELLYAVARKFPGESRHETALRYIRDTEERVSQSGSCRQNETLCNAQAESEG